jgi:hypothetical protein
MPQSFIVLIIVAVIALIAVSAYYSYQAQQKRIAELSQLGASHGWQFDQSQDSTHDDRYNYFSIFNQGDDRYAYNTLRGDEQVGERPWPVQLGDYHYRTTSTSTDSKGNTTTTYHHHQLSYLIVDTPYLGAPHLFVRREGFFDKLANFFGFSDINFESEEFSRRFRVKSPDKKFAYDVIHPRMMEFLLAEEPPMIDFQRGQCCLSRGERCWPAIEFESNLDWARRFFELWPRHVTNVLEQAEADAHAAQETNRA